MANNNISKTTDLDKLLQTSYLSKSRRELLDPLLITSNVAAANRKTKNQTASITTLLQNLNTFQVEIYGVGNWKDRLQDVHNGMTHYQEMLSRRPGGCGQPSNCPQHTKKCRECKMDFVTLENTPSGLITFIRNTHEHAPDKMDDHPGGVLETFLFPKPNGYDVEDKRHFVDYFMSDLRYPKLFHIVAALREDQIAWIDWSDDCPPDQVLKGLHNVYNFHKDHGNIIAKLECPQLFGGGKCTLEILSLDSPVISANMGKVICISNTAITIHQNLEEPLSYSIKNPLLTNYNFVFGLKQIDHATLSSGHVILVPSKFETIHLAKMELENFGAFEFVPMTWNELSPEAQHRISSLGTIHIQNQVYPAAQFNLENLEGDQLIDLLKTQRLELFKGKTRVQGYVERYVLELLSFKQRHAAGVLRVTKDVNCEISAGGFLFINSDNELIALNHLSPDTREIILHYDASFEGIYDKIKELAGERSVNLRTFVANRYSKVVRDYLRVIPERDIVEKTKTNVVFISGPAGEGKTALMEHLRFSLCLPETVVIHKFANEFLTNEDIRWPQTLGQCLKLNSFEINVVESLNVVLVIDGLDEVEPAEFEFALSNIKYLRRLKKLKIIVSVRSFKVDDVYPKFSSETFCELGPLGTEGQIQVFMTYSKNVEEGTARQLITTFRKYFLPTALQCKLFGEIYSDLGSNSIISDFVPMDKLQLYQLVVEKNFYWYLTEKSGFSESKLSLSMKKHLLEEYTRAHMYLAIKNLLEFDADKLKGPLAHHDIKLVAGQGLLDNINPVQFTHVTIAEFFLDTWIFQVITGQLQLQEGFKSAFGELFRSFYDDCLLSDFLILLLKQPWKPLYFDLPLVVIDCFDILNSTFISTTSNILRKLIGSYRKYSPETFEEELRKLQSKTRSVYLREYNCSEPELPSVTYTISADLLVEWFCLDTCPNTILETFPEGFYLEDSQPEKVEDSSTPVHIAGARLRYIPKNNVVKDAGWTRECFLVPYANEVMGPRGSWVPNKKHKITYPKNFVPRERHAKQSRGGRSYNFEDHEVQCEAPPRFAARRGR